jgi:hypothetical protein
MKSIVFLPIAVIIRAYFAAGYVLTIAIKAKSNMQSGVAALKALRPAAQPTI